MKISYAKVVICIISVLLNPSVLETGTYFNVTHDTVLEAYVEPTPEPEYYEQEFVLTWYTASDDECGKSDGITTSGVLAQEGCTIACDSLPLGTQVEIDGHVYTVQDRFGGGYLNKIDIYTESYDHAINMGRQYKIVKILK